MLESIALIRGAEMKKMSLITMCLEGISSIICLYPNENKRRIHMPYSSFCNGLKNDWEKIGFDMWNVCKMIDSQSKDKYR